MIDADKNCARKEISPPTAKTLFGLLRHGKTKWNEQKRIQGHGDSPLTPEGRKQTVIWSYYLKHFQWDRILASDLGRVKETVSILNKRLTLPVTWEKRFREQNWGSWEGMRFPEIERASPELLKQQILAGWDFHAPQGESRRSVQKRVEEACLEAVTKWPEEKILVVCHQGVIKCLIYHIAKRSFLPDEPELLYKNKLHTLQYTDGSLHIEHLNRSPQELT